MRLSERRGSPSYTSDDYDPESFLVTSHLGPPNSGNSHTRIVTGNVILISEPKIKQPEAICLARAVLRKTCEENMVNPNPKT